MFSKNLVLLFVFFIISYCSIDNTSNTDSAENLKREHKSYKSEPVSIIKTPHSGDVFKLGDSITINIKIKKKIKKTDSVQFYIGEKHFVSLHIIDDQVGASFIINDLNVGIHILKSIIYYNDSLKEIKRLNIKLLSDIAPRIFSYKVINIFPHNIESFTQGLVYEGGFLFEGTGQWGKSNLLKHDISTGKLVGKVNLTNDLFGEGITVFDDKIIQLTWKSNIGFIYDKNSFNFMHKVYYEAREGWGITYDGIQLIMSDGTNVLYFIDKIYFTEIKQVEVYDDLGAVSSLNELEYINGEVYANIYRKDQIVSIDPETGKILKKINLNGLLDQKDYHDKIDVLNGIAYNAEKNTYYLTGKNWPKLFELKFIPK